MIRLEGASLAVRDASGASRTLLEPTDLAIHAGERRLILGANGSGKTTLIRLLAGLAAPTSGGFLLDGAPIHGTEGPSLWPRVAVLFEEPDPQFLAETVASEIAFGLESMALPAAETRARVETALDEGGLQALAARDPRTLSAGEKVRTLLAAALAARPGALLVDQCFAHLDPASRRSVEARIAAEVGAGRLAVVRASQELDPPAPGERVHLIEHGALRDLSGLPPASILAARSAPLPLALRLSAALALQGRWDGPLAMTTEEFADALAGFGTDAGHAGPPVPPTARQPARLRGETGGGTREHGDPSLVFSGVSWTPSRRAAPVVEGISFEVGGGEIVALVGASGTGKSTLLHLAAGLREPAGGRVERAPAAPSGAPDVMLALEYPERQLFARTVAEDVAAALWVQGAPAEERARRSERALRDAGLDPIRFGERAPSTLSEGEKRRVALAAFLVTPPRVMLLDEPTAGLDPEGRRALRAVLFQFRDQGRAVLFASHDLDFVASAADRVLVLERKPGGPGRLLGGGTPEGVWSDAALLSRADLPTPDACLLGRALAARGYVPAGPFRDADALVEAISLYGAVDRMTRTR